MRVCGEGIKLSDAGESRRRVRARGCTAVPVWVALFLVPLPLPLLIVGEPEEGAWDESPCGGGAGAIRFG